MLSIKTSIPSLADSISLIDNHTPVQTAAEITGYNLQYLRRLLRAGKLDALKLVIGPLCRDKIEKQHLGPRGIGREYQVRFVLDGTISKRDQSLRVAAKLTVPLAVNIFKETLSRRSSILSDYEAILRFHQHIRFLTEESQVEAITALEHLIGRDPNHALAAAMVRL